MKDSLIQKIKDFLSRHAVLDKPLLLGYSGGPDSKALLYLLLECRSYFNFKLHLAHVDHGWRMESRREAELLEKEAQDLCLPFHLRRLDPGSFKKGNWEEQARTFRLQFFFDIYSTFECQALLLAHQAEDHAEVVLKRICEGAHVSRLSGFSACTILETMQIWRPLLSVQKKTLIGWLEKRCLPFFSDQMNTSDRFLRGRMRTGLFPLLTEHFGKEIVDNFCRLGEMTEQLRSYFLKKLKGHLQEIVTSALGSYWEVPSHLEEIEVQFLLREWFTKEKISVSREILSALGRKVKSGEIARFSVQGIWIHSDRKRVFILRHSLASIFAQGSWTLEISDAEEKKPYSWMNFWQGNVWGCLPQGKSFEWIQPSLAANCPGMKAAKEERKRLKVPSFLCESVPLICNNGEIIFDVLTGLNNLNYNYNDLNIIYIKLDLFNKHCDKLNKICYDHEKRPGL